VSPEETVARYFECIRTEAYAEAAALLSEECIRRFREHEVPMMRPSPKPTLEGYMERNPGVPREVAEHYLAQAESHSWPTLSDYFAGVESVDELETLSDRELFARHIEASDYAARHRGVIDRLRERYPEHERKLLEVRDAQARTWSFHFFGALVEEDRAWVLFGWPDPEDRSVLRWEPTPHVAVVRREADGWRIAADPSPYTGMGIAMGPIEVEGDDGRKIRLDPYEVV